MNDHPRNLTPTKTSSRRFTPLPDVFLRGECSGEPDDEPQEIIVARAEARARARQRRNGSRLLRGTDKQFAEALHREADSLHYKGDYETALVLYHRAASVCPRDSSHGVAVRRTAAAINALAHPNKALNGLLPKVKNGAQQSAMVCPESAAFRASRILGECSDPVSVVPEILRFFDGRADFWRIPKTRVLPPRRNRVSVKRSGGILTPRIRKMEVVLRQGDPVAALRIGEEILTDLGNGSMPESVALHRYKVMVYSVLALAHVALGRHDRAVTSASGMTKAALALNVPLPITEALVTLGKVHLTFGHLRAAARAWESILPHVSALIPRAWLLHEIGRCHLENGDYEKALELAAESLGTAEAADSEKWIFHGRLLLGQTLAQLGRFEEAARALRSLTLAGEQAGDARTLAYIRDLEERLVSALKNDERSNGCPEVQRAEQFPDEHLSDSSTRFGYGSGYGSGLEEDLEEEVRVNECFPDITPAESLRSEESSYSLRTTSSRSVLVHGEPNSFEISATAGDPDDREEQESSITSADLKGLYPSRESILTGRTYGVSSPLFYGSMSQAGTSKRRDVTEAEIVSTIFGP